MNTFGASVQYNDWKGTVAADDANKDDIHKLLRDRGEISDGEFLLGVELWLGEMHGGKLQRPFVKALIIDAENYEAAEQNFYATEDPLPLKVIEMDLSMDEFLLLFKRFAVSISWQGLDLTGREYSA